MIAINPRQRHAASFERIGGRFAGRRLPAARGARANSEDSDSDGGDANFVVCGGQIAGESSVEDEYAVKRLWAKQRINAVVFFLVPPPHVETRATDPYKLSNSRACGPETPVGLILYPGCRGVASHYFFLLNNINLYIPLFGKWERENIEEHGAGRTHGSGGAPDPLRARTLGRRHHDTLPHHVEETRRVGHRDLRLCKRARHAWQRVHGLRAVRGRRHSAQISTGWNPGYCVRHLEYWRGKELEGEGKAAVIAGETCEENGVKFLATD
ncbi:hypothetical protein PC118_g22046 [Phytophthora cactorum]|uniref:Uncharacterized protein n=1 Tax=Phytophthora cactorum TaxID=29920 RepID=A0A8T1EY20_9STRA|nr:hypothetical protein PC111_g21865 [Phytophthora cactorum]KAG2825761.1 hypothetical protein PC113_g21863 [Phytophthora cactorum]KAG2889476.1 hypothetical protein PC117_g24682 [Phytophthora cactorum]KAG2961304.1 hypothetical protein PC118_g22046 [Phytophthora cactorum]